MVVVVGLWHANVVLFFTNFRWLNSSDLPYTEEDNMADILVQAPHLDMEHVDDDPEAIFGKPLAKLCKSTRTVAN